MLTDDDIKLMVEKHIGTDANYKCTMEIEFAREVIAANNAKALEGMRAELFSAIVNDVAKALGKKFGDTHHDLAQQVEALVDRVKKLEE